MNSSHITIAIALATAFAAPEAFSQSSGNTQSPSREAVRSEAISSHRDGTMLHNEVGPKAKPFQSTKSRQEVRAEAISSHKDGTMVHNEAGPKAKPFKSTKTRKEVRDEAIASHKDGTMVHSEVTPATPK
jgi:hypothetical protein